MTQPAFAEETLDECVSYQNLPITNQTGVNDVVLCSGVFSVSFKQILHCSAVSITDFEQGNVG